MKYYLLLLAIIRFTSCIAQAPVERMVLQLSKADFGAVYQARDSLIKYQKESMPSLIKLLKDTSFVKLQNTADLIYPGAKEFYGHGWIVNYDIDWISVRAAWLLEEITFQDFGYQDRSITEDKLMDLHRNGYQTYLRDGFHQIDFRDKSPKERLKLYRLVLADSVASWWSNKSNEWTRYDALKEALASGNEHRQALALQYLRFGKTKCDGFTPEKYKVELKPLVIRIKNSNSPQAVQANYLLRDED
jgi:hypothetical protein